MIKEILIGILLAAISWADCLSQQLSHQVLVPVAGVATCSKVAYSQTIGETAVEIFGCSNYFFTQGFQQPEFKISGETQPAGNGVKVYPNPVRDYMVIELFGESARTFRIDIVNITGNIVSSERRIFSDRYWYKEHQNIDDLIKGFYIVRIVSEDGMIDRSFKIEKI